MWTIEANEKISVTFFFYSSLFYLFLLFLFSIFYYSCNRIKHESLEVTSSMWYYSFSTSPSTFTCLFSSPLCVLCIVVFVAIFLSSIAMFATQFSKHTCENIISTFNNNCLLQEMQETREQLFIVLLISPTWLFYHIITRMKNKKKHKTLCHNM